MKKYPLECRILKPFRYTNSAETNVAETLKRARKALEEEAKAAEATNVRPMRKEKRAA